MSRLVRMDQTGHTTLAEWSAEDLASVQSAVAAFATSSTGASTPSSPAARVTPSRSVSFRSMPTS